MKLNELKYVEERFPYFISANYQKIFANRTSEERIKIILHTYDLLLRTLTIGVLSQYWGKDKNRVSDPFLNDLLLQKLPQLTLDAWQKIFFASLETYKNHKELLFMPEVYDLYWGVAGSSPDNLRSNFEEPFRRLTQISAEVTVEDLKPKDETEWQDLCDESGQLLADIIEQVKFLANYQLIRVSSRENQICVVEQYQGQTIVLREYDVAEIGDLQTGWFYWRDMLGNVLPLHPMFVFWEESVGVKDVAVYDRVIVRQMQYLLALLGKTIMGSGNVEEFVNLIFTTLEEAKGKKNTQEKFTWESLQEKSFDISKLKMSTVQYKYRPHLYLPRNKAREAFDGFMKSDKKCFVLIGKSGVGKSNFLLALSDELREHREICLLMYDGAQLRVEPSITETINQDFKTRLNLVDVQFNVWQEINKINIGQDRKVILLVDAINENPDSKQLLRQLDELAESPWPWLKIVFTSRPETWYVIRRGVKLAEALYYQERGIGTIGIELEPFSYSEELQPFTRQELPEVYEKHRKAFNLSTRYEELNSELKDSIQDPLNLWLVSNIYQNGSIPVTLYSTKLIEDYIGALLKSGRISSIDLNFLEKKLIPLMSRGNGFKNSINMEDMDSAGGLLFEAVYSEQILRDGRRMNQSFTNLVDADILVRQEEGRNQKIAFKYERFYEYFFGFRLYELAKASSDQVLYYLNLIDSTSQFPFLWGAIKGAIINEVKNDGEKVVVELCVTDDQRTKELMVVALTEAGSDTYIDKILDDILNHKRGNRIFKRLINKKSHEQSLINAQKIVIEVASNLGLIKLLASIAETKSAQLRAHVVKYSYYLWRRDPDTGWLLMEAMIERVRKGLFLNLAALNFIVNFTLLIFLQHFDDENQMPLLKKVFHQTLEKALYLDESIRLWKDVKQWVRNILIQTTIGLVEELAAKSPRHFPANISEIKLFFKLPKEDRKNVLEIINYYEYPDFGNVNELVDLTKKILKTNDAYATYILTQVIVVQYKKYRKELLPIFWDLALDALKKQPDSAIPFQILTPLYWACLYNSELIEENIDTLELVKEIEHQKALKSRGIHYYQSGILYAGGITFTTLAISDLVNSGYYPASTKYPAEEYILIACNEKDWQFSADLIWQLEEMAVIYKKWTLSLNLCLPFLELNHSKVNDALVQYFARLRLYQPHMVDDFLAQNDGSGDLTKRVIAAETGEQENVIFGKAFPFLYHEVPNSPQLRTEAANLYRQIILSKNIREAIIIVVKRLINLAYGEELFLVPKSHGDVKGL